MEYHSDLSFLRKPSFIVSLVAIAALIPLALSFMPVAVRGESVSLPVSLLFIALVAGSALSLVRLGVDEAFDVFRLGLLGMVFSFLVFAVLYWTVPASTNAALSRALPSVIFFSIFTPTVFAGLIWIYRFSRMPPRQQVEV